MPGISFIDFYLVACDFLKFDWCKTLSGHVGFSLNIQHPFLENDCCISRNVGKLKSF